MKYVLVTAGDHLFGRVKGGAMPVVDAGAAVGVAETAEEAERLLGGPVKRGRALIAHPGIPFARGFAADTDAWYPAAAASPPAGVSLYFSLAEIGIDPSRAVRADLDAVFAGRVVRVAGEN